MYLIRIILLFSVCLWGWSQDGGKGIEVDFLGSYYDQTGEHSPVTGGIGDEALTSASPVFVVRYVTPSQWSLSADLGVDNITSASTDNMDLGEIGDHVSGASRKDNRVFTTLSASHPFGNQTWGFSVGFSGEYDYRSLNGGLNWSVDLNGKNTTLGAGVRHFADTIDLYGIDGIKRGTDDRTTTDFSLSLTQVLSQKTVGVLEFSLSEQSGFLSSPFQEVILDTGEHVAERLPDSRSRMALRLSVNHAFSPRLIQRAYIRAYDDDFGIQAQTLELETHIRLPWQRETWLYPILRYHDQSGSDYFGLPGVFSETDEFFTADRDLGEFKSTKLGVGMSFSLPGRIRRFDWRATYYDRDDGLSAFALSFGFGWSF